MSKLTDMSKPADNKVVVTTGINDKTIYSSFAHATKCLAGLVAVDYFFAKEITQCIPLHLSTSLTATMAQQQQYFHLLIALSASLREGHSCLPLSAVANKRLFVGQEIQANQASQAGTQQNNITHIAQENSLTESVKSSGFLFDNLTKLTALLEQQPLAEHENQPIVFNNQRLYLRRYYQFEQELKQAVTARSIIKPVPEHQIQTQTELIKGIIAQLFPDTVTHTAANSINEGSNTSTEKELDWQAIAVANAINKDFAIIAGGPGTGKTYTVTKLLAALIMLSLAKQKNHDVNEAPSALNTPEISLVAPTGKAAQRLSESIINAVQGFRGDIDDQVLDLIPENAKTLHRLLGVIPEQVNFRHHQQHLLEVDILLIDEVSMVDLPMMARIFRALPPHAKVILLGDADQLPSVAVGSVLADFAPRPHQGFSAINHEYLTQVTGFKNLKLHTDATDIKTKSSDSEASGKYYSAADCVTFLTKSRRFDGQGGIGKIAKYVIKGQYQESWQLLQESSPVHPSTTKNSKVVNNNADNQADNGVTAEQESALTLLYGSVDSWLAPLVSQYYQPLSECENIADAFALLTKFRILSSTRKGPQGVENLNTLVIEILRNKGLVANKKFGSKHDLFPKQPIMISENNYRLGIYNGDIGLLWRNDQGDLMAVFENASGEYQWIMPSRLPKFETVYAMTIHKTQGSEFEHVAMVLPEQKDNKLLSRELLYTGITRAKSKLSIASTKDIWRSGVNQRVIRYSGLTVGS